MSLPAQTLWDTSVEKTPSGVSWGGAVLAGAAAAAALALILIVLGAGLGMCPLLTDWRCAEFCVNGFSFSSQSSV
jgi:hypothetical protein